MTTQVGVLNKGYGDPGWNLYDGLAIRQVGYNVVFPTPYSVPPKVLVSLAYLEADRNYNTAIKVWAENISADKFEVIFHAWDDAKIIAAGVSWLATDH